MSAHQQAVPLLAEAYKLCSQGREQKALEKVLLWLEQGLSTARWGIVDVFLAKADTSHLAPSVVVGTLSITVSAKDFLRSRDAFVRRAEECLRASLGGDRMEALLAIRR